VFEACLLYADKPVVFFADMANTYTQLHAHLVFSTRNRELFFEPRHAALLEAYIAGFCHNRGLEVLAMKVMPEHIHLLFRFRVNMVLDEFVKDLKVDSNQWIGEKRLFKRAFYWQRGYGLFVVNQQQLPAVVSYIEQQEHHHKKETFDAEYLRWLQEEGITERLEYALDMRKEVTAE
jgi:putative transposase